MQVADVMTQASVSDAPDDTLHSAAARMWEQQTGSLVVMEGDTLVGIITERDVLKAAAHGVDLEATTVAESMTRQVVTTTPDTPLRNAARVMAQHWIRHLPVVDGTKVVGVLSQRDVLGVFAALSREPGAVEIETDQMVRARRLVRIEHGDLD